MLIRRPQTNSPFPELLKSNAPERNSSDIDTSILYTSLKNQFQSTGQPVEVDFRRLVDWIKQGDQITHLIHRYPAKLLPQIAHFFSRATILTQESTGILDPFCGSGTVALETSIAGKTPYIADSNPLALLITKVKTSSYDVDELKESLKLILSRARKYKKSPSIPIVNGEHWYHDRHKKSLEHLLRAIHTLSDQKVQDFFKVCFSNAAHRLSYADPSIAVPVRLRVKDNFSSARNDRVKTQIAKIESACTFAQFREICEANIKRIEAVQYLHPNRVTHCEIVGDDARTLSTLKPESTIDLSKSGTALTITSPPYGAAQKYIRSTSLSLNWLGFATPETLKLLENNSIGREHVRNANYPLQSEGLPKEHLTLLKSIESRNHERYVITMQYLIDMKRALREIVQVTRPNGHIVIVIGNNTVCGEPLRNDHFVSYVLREFGCNLEAHLVDTIKSRGLMTKRNRTSSVISRESVLIFSKM